MPFLEDVLPEDEESTFDPDNDILEIIGDEQPGGGSTFALEDAEATLVYVFDWRKCRSFVRFMLGFSFADEGSPYKLRRENPQIHPSAPTLTASTVHFSSIAPTKNTDPVKESDPEDTPNYPAVFVDTQDTALSKTGFYDKVYATVRFTPKPWQFFPDERLTSYDQEIERNWYVDPTPSIELLTADGGESQLKFNQTWAGGPALNDVIGNTMAERVVKVTYNAHWLWVPESYISLDSNPMPIFTNIFNCMGKVNSTTFGNFPAGTVYMLAPKMQRFRWPISTFDGINSFWGWNITFPLVYFNPTLGVPDPDPTNDSIPRGHRTMPWSGDGKWGEAIRKTTMGTRHLLEEADLNDIFKHISDPG